jgi:organic radical activating enzyme
LTTINDKFPIRQGVACPLKWSWNTLRLSEATSASCHRVEGVPLTVDNIKNFHNLPTWVEHRKMQLRGEFPQEGCQYCGDIEAAGGISDRLYHMDSAGLCPPELETDPLSVNVTPRIFEIFLNNKCNMSCIYCDESNSSRIEFENRTHGYTVPGVNEQIIPKIDNLHQQGEDLYPLVEEWLDENLQYLNQINILGGEPFYQPEFYKLTDFLFSRTNPQLELTVITNLKVDFKRLDSFLEKAKTALANRQLKKLRITASIDCWGDPQEYVRYGIDMDEWQRSFEYLVKQKWIELNINNAMTSLTIKTLPELLEYVNQFRKDRIITHTFCYITGKEKQYQNPRRFPNGFWDKDFERILSLMPTDTKQEKNAYKYMEGISKYVNNSDKDGNTVELTKLMHYLNEIDRRRNTNWQKTFPWLEEYYKSCGILK